MKKAKQDQQEKIESIEGDKSKIVEFQKNEKKTYNKLLDGLKKREREIRLIDQSIREAEKNYI